MENELLNSFQAKRDIISNYQILTVFYLCNGERRGKLNLQAVFNVKLKQIIFT